MIVNCASTMIVTLLLPLIALRVTTVTATTEPVEYCDLNFINDAEAKVAMDEFITINSSTHDVLNEINGKFSHSWREKRQATGAKQRTIETAIFVDHHLERRFANRLNDLKRLVMSVMNEVQLIYNYKTMKIPIRIVIVRFEILQSPEISPDTAGGDIDRYLDNFCSWQAVKLRSLASNARWDHALLLTGLDLYKDVSGKRNKKVLGLAWVSIDHPSTRLINNNLLLPGKSFEAAFVIAHEMAHRRGNGRCLDNDPSPRPELDFQATSRLPGEQYSPDLQCQLALGTQYKAYFSPKEPFNDACRELWCLSGSWATPAHPALEGSPCGDNGAKCYQGSCSLARDSRGAIDRRRARMRPAVDNKRNIIRRPTSGTSNRLRVSLGLAPIGNGIFNRRRGATNDHPVSSEKMTAAAHSSPVSQTSQVQTNDFWSSFVSNAKSLLQRLLLL